MSTANIVSGSTETFRFTVDFSLSLAEMVKSESLWIDVWLLDFLRTRPIELFSKAHSREFEAYPFELEGTPIEMAPEAIRMHDPQNPWSSAGIEHMLTFSACFPMQSPGCAIVGPSFVKDEMGHPHWLVLTSAGTRRNLFCWPINYLTSKKGVSKRFLGVRAVSAD